MTVLRSQIVWMITLCGVVLTSWLLFMASSDKNADAAVNDTLFGWAWSSNIGWISMNSANCDADNNGESDGTPAGCPSAGTAIPAYGVRVDPNTGNFSGYAWSENIGWINFSPDTASAPEDPNQGVRLEGGLGGSLEGWARAVSQNGVNDPEPGEWDGWIKLSGTTSGGEDYGVDIDFGSSYGELSGFAWGGDVIGWVDFSGVSFGVAYAPKPEGIITANGQETEFITDTLTPITLGWETAFTNNCRIEPGSIDVDTIGTIEIGTISATEIFGLYCDNAPYFTNELVSSVTVTVVTGGTPTLTLDKRIVRVGDTVTLSYDTNGNPPENCEIRGPDGVFPSVPVSEEGTVEFTAAAAATYTMECPAGDIAEVTLQIVPGLWES